MPFQWFLYSSVCVAFLLDGASLTGLQMDIGSHNWATLFGWSSTNLILFVCPIAFAFVNVSGEQISGADAEVWQEMLSMMAWSQMLVAS